MGESEPLEKPWVGCRLSSNVFVDQNGTPKEPCSVEVPEL